MSLDAEQLKRMIAGQEAAAAASLRALQVPDDATVAFDQAMDLWDLRPELFDAPPDVTRVREIEQARDCWARLREKARR